MRFDEFRIRSAEILDLRRRQRLRDAELGEAGHWDAAVFERMQRLFAAELESLLRMQGGRDNKPVFELGKDKDKANFELANHQKMKVEVAHPKDKGKVKAELAQY